MFNHTTEGINQGGRATKRTTQIALVCAAIGAIGASGFAANAHTSKSENSPGLRYTDARITPVLADAALLRSIGIEPKAIEPLTQVGFAELTSEQQTQLSERAHEEGRCGGYEALNELKYAPTSLVLPHVFGQLAEQEMKNRRFVPSMELFGAMQFKPEIKAAVDEVSPDRIRDSVQFLSSFPNRDNRDSKSNDSILAFKTRIEETLKDSRLSYQVELVSHGSTRQSSIRARIIGSSRPNEVIVMGAHIDSINQSWTGGRDAPGADDNASGSSNILEALRIVSKQPQPERTLEFMWYAGEESGLLGSAEIAKSYKAQNKDVIAVLQLDMTLFPGDGEFVIASMNDFTSAWLRSYLQTLNTLYLNIRILDDNCGYGCSDHASWHRQGYPALMPTEASFRRMNKNLHTSRDVIEPRLNFAHSAVFSKIAVAIALDLGNSAMREVAQ